MTTEAQVAPQELDEFVDRKSEMERFKGVLADPSTPVMAVWGDGGLGKSWLMAKMIHECSSLEYARAVVRYSKDEVWDYLAVMRQCRDALGATKFLPFTNLVNSYFDQNYVHVDLRGANISVGNDMTITEGARVGDISGVKIEIRDAMSSTPRPDLNVSEAERRRKITDQFLQNLAESFRAPTVVIFIDGAEYMSAATKNWLWESVIPGVIDRGLRNFRFVILGRERPQVDRSAARLTVFNELKALAEPDIIEYLGRRGVPEAEWPTLVKVCLKRFKGRPADIAVLVDSLVQSDWEQQ